MTPILNGKVAIVTGASSGIGEATAIALATAGATVALVARRGDRLNALADKIEALGGKAIPCVADIANESEIQSVVDKVSSAQSRIDILINNAGVQLLGAVESANTDEWRRMVNINLLGLSYAVHAVLPTMKFQQSGHIVNLSSVAGRYAVPNGAMYSATKWGVCAFSESLRREVIKDKIRVTLIEPGGVATELNEHNTDQATTQWLKDYEQNIQFLQSEDIANAILYAVSQPPHVSVNEILIRPSEQEL